MMKSRNSKPTMWMTKHKYVDNIAHIEDFIKRNMTERECIVELYVRPLTNTERHMYGLPPRNPKVQVPRPTTTRQKNGRVNSKLESRPHKISGTDLRKWRDKVQGV